MLWLGDLVLVDLSCKSSTVSQTAARLRRSGKANDPGKPRVTPLKSVRFAESNKVSVKRRKWTRHSPDNRQSSGRPSKRRRRESYAVIQATATTVRLRRRRRARPTSSKWKLCTKMWSLECANNVQRIILKLQSNCPLLYLFDFLTSLVHQLVCLFCVLWLRNITVRKAQLHTLRLMSRPEARQSENAIDSDIDRFQMWRQNLWTGGQDKRKSPCCNEVYYHAKSNPLFCPPVQLHSHQLKGVYRILVHYLFWRVAISGLSVCLCCKGHLATRQRQSIIMPGCEIVQTQRRRVVWLNFLPRPCPAGKESAPSPSPSRVCAFPPRDENEGDWEQEEEVQFNCRRACSASDWGRGNSFF